MGNRNKSGPRRTPRPTNPSEHELQILQRLMNDAIAVRVRVEDSARQLAADYTYLRLLVAALLLQQGGSVTLSDDMLARIGHAAELTISKDTETRTLTLSVVLPDEGEEE